MTSLQPTHEYIAPEQPYEKQAETIIGVDKLAALRQLTNKAGFSAQPFPPFAEAVRWNLIEAPRKTLEGMTSVLHFITYTLLRLKGTSKVLAYQRPSQNNGEVKLSGKWSIGLGGHIEGLDVVRSEKSVTQLVRTFRNAALREVHEEVILVKNGEQRRLLDYVEGDGGDREEFYRIEDLGFIVDWDDVGLTHIAVVTVIDIDADVDVISGEDQLENVQFIDLLDTAALRDRPFENWSNILATHVRSAYMETITDVVPEA